MARKTSLKLSQTKSQTPTLKTTLRKLRPMTTRRRRPLRAQSGGD